MARPPAARVSKTAAAGNAAGPVRPTRRLKPAEIAALFARLKKANPKPVTELQYNNAYTLLVAVVLSAQATDAGVNKATGPLFRKFDTPQKMLRLGLDGLKDYVRTIGLYNGKAQNIIRLSQILVDQHKGEVPRDREALEALPGVGRKTANVVLNVVWGEKTMAVDTHVFRVANRTGLAPGANPRAVEDELMAVIPGRFMDHAHHWLILHGRYTCIARAPKCGICPIYDICRWPEKQLYAADMKDDGHAEAL